MHGQGEPDTTTGEAVPPGRHDLAPLGAGLTAFAAVLLVAVVLIPARHDVSPGVRAAWPLLLVVPIGLMLRRTPSSRLTPEQRARRDRWQLGAVLGLLTSLLVLGVIATVASLRTWSDTVVLGALVIMGLGQGLMLQTRFTIGG